MNFITQLERDGLKLVSAKDVRHMRHCSVAGVKTGVKSPSHFKFIVVDALDIVTVAAMDGDESVTIVVSDEMPADEPKYALIVAESDPEFICFGLQKTLCLLGYTVSYSSYIQEGNTETTNELTVKW